MKTIAKILVANRGEIALRIMRTCRRLGIGTVAVFSDADADMPFVRFADEAVRLGPAPAAESYLVIDKIIAAARRTGADAVHPGYGFLSENAAFARACAEAGITFIGPSPEVIHLLGSKKEAKHAAVQAGVPVVPGYNGDDQSTETLVARAADIGFPLLVKASAGGGGKGMRIVRAAADTGDAIARARSEAKNAFGDDTLILERYVERPRHVEIQILGDHHGHLVHLWERECSIQRRHQKVIEEAPSPALDDALRARMGAAGVAVGQGVGYTSAGTVEFIVAPDGSFYFLEVNTRLQVEHPVTEAITGLDLVEQQIRVARGEPLAFSAAPPIRGHAIEVRLYAEDADAGYLPTTGTVRDWHLPELAGLRVDAGVETGTEVGIHYDPMLAKIIAHAATRRDAIAVLRSALAGASIAGLTTNRDHLHRVLGHPAFGAGELDTHFLDHHGDALRPASPTPARIRAAAVAATVVAFHARRGGPLPHVEPGWRNVPFADQAVTYTLGERAVEVRYRNLGADQVAVTIDGEASVVRGVVVREVSPAIREVAFEDDGHRVRRRVVGDGARWSIDGLVLVEAPRFPDAVVATVAGGLVAPMPGKVVQVLVEAGQAVVAGATLLVLEAMKMEHTVRAPEDGVVSALHVATGEQVDADQLLAVVSPAA
jgi:acetyl-CoA carboxylase biotin carboxylase subunit